MSKYKAAEKTFEFFYDRLVRGYKSVMGKEPEGLDKIKIKQEAKAKQIEANKVIEVDFGEPFAELIKKGEITKGTAFKTPPYTPSKSQTDFEIQTRLESDNAKAIESFKKRNPKEDMVNPERDSFKKISNVLGAFKKYRRGEKDPALNFNQFFELFSKENFATGGRAGYYGGGITNMVGEDLSEIGHGSDALMSRNMQLAPNSMATTSTGLNYLLGQDNDTARVPYNKGKLAKKAVDEGRRGFLKTAGSVGAGIAALKTGLLGFGEKVAPVVEKVAEAAGQTPEYFFQLVEKIKALGTVSSKLAVKDKEIVTTYSSGKPGYSKDYTLTEDITTGEMTIQRTKMDDDLIYDASEYYGRPIQEEVYMSYKPGKGLADETTKGKNIPDEYTEDTSLIRNDKPARGEISDTFNGVPDDILKEVEAGSGNVPDSFYTGPNAIKKADGGRIGYNKGKIVKEGIEKLIKAGEGKFTKAEYLIERIKNTIKGSPDDKYVQETFPGFIDELTANPDLAKNENVFKELGGDLPEGQQIVVYGDDTLDFFTTSSGPKNIKKLDQFMAKHDLSRDQALEIMKMEPNDQVMELTKTKFMKQKRTDNSTGGFIGYANGGPITSSGLNYLMGENDNVPGQLVSNTDDGSRPGYKGDPLEGYNRATRKLDQGVTKINGPGERVSSKIMKHIYLDKATGKEIEVFKVKITDQPSNKGGNMKAGKGGDYKTLLLGNDKTEFSTLKEAEAARDNYYEENPGKRIKDPNKDKISKDDRRSQEKKKGGVESYKTGKGDVVKGHSGNIFGVNEIRPNEIIYTQKDINATMANTKGAVDKADNNPLKSLDFKQRETEAQIEKVKKSNLSEVKKKIELKKLDDKLVNYSLEADGYKTATLSDGSKFGTSFQSTKSMDMFDQFPGKSEKQVKEFVGEYFTQKGDLKPKYANAKNLPQSVQDNIVKAYTFNENVKNAQANAKKSVNKLDLVKKLKVIADKGGSKGKAAAQALAIIIGTTGGAMAGDDSEGLSGTETAAIGGAAAGTLAFKTSRKVLGNLLNAAGLPLSLGINAAIGIDPKSSFDRTILAGELALAPGMIKAATSTTDKIKNPLLKKAAQFATTINPKYAMKAARFANPVGLAALAGEAVYNVGKLGYEDQKRFNALSPEEQMFERAEQRQFANSIKGS